MLIQKWPQMPYMVFPLDWQVWVQETIQFILHSANLFSDERLTFLGNQILHRRSGIISIHVIHPPLYKSSSSREAISKLAKYERDRGKWKMLTRNVATYAAILIPQMSVRAADEELTPACLEA